ncbi:MAG: tetratricopeptide repeat protein [Bacteroidetes bacterium]|nr:MAG: tetratricopeptide repeat protein [Bacteroidota bacterium]
MNFHKSLRYFFVWVAFAGIFPCYPVFAQKTKVYSSDIKEYVYGTELFDKQKYAAAQKQFEIAIKKLNDPYSPITGNAEYYMAVCAIELFNKDGELLLKRFIEHHPDHPKVRTAYFHLGRYNYRKHKWKKVIEYFSHVDMYDLTNEEVAEYHFKTGYSYFKLGDYENASKSFYEIKDTDNPYTTPSRYYFAHIEYIKGNYQTALEDFNKIKNDKKFAPIVPYYITQILYLQGKYDELLQYAPQLLDSATPKRAPEIARLIGEAYFNKKEYENAIPYLIRYQRESHKATPEDKYQLGYAFYKTGNCKEAVKLFKSIPQTSDTLAQLAYYHLADCYLKSGKKKYAINAFKKVYELNIDKELSKNAFFNYAKLSYETSFDPYHTAVDLFLDFIEQYPNAPEKEEAYQYLLNAYLNTKNYKKALESFEKLRPLSPKMKEIQQIIAYNYGVELYQNKKYTEALSIFKKAVEINADPKLSAKAKYRIADIYYKQKQYDKALTAFQEFMFMPSAILLKEFPKANYNIGYCYFEQKDYENAAKWFRKYISLSSGIDSLLLNDACLRTADAYFVLKDYYKAKDFYQKAYEIGKIMPDYALYQKAMAMGIIKKREEKKALLETLVSRFPNSEFIDDALYELGKYYLIKNQPDLAVEHFQKIVTDYPKSPYVKKSLLNIGLVYYNNDENEKALEAFNKIIQQYPNYEDSKEALEAIKNIYIRMGKTEEYARLTEQLDFLDVSTAEMDSVTYEAAELQYLKGNCDKAIELLEKYLKKFEKPLFALSANYYKSECYYQKGQYDKALEGYEFIINQPVNKYSEEALYKASLINFTNQRFDKALSNYLMLEKIAENPDYKFDAQEGLMKTYFFMKDFVPAIQYADIVLENNTASPEQKVESQFIKAKSFYALDSLDAAYEHFKAVSHMTKSEKSAESKYYMANIMYQKDSLQKTEQLIYELVNQVPSYPYWVAKGLILLADVYYKSGDTFQAKATLQSIIDNYEGKDLKQIAQEKLREISEKEETQEPVQTPDTLNIFNNPEYEDLFEPEEE